MKKVIFLTILIGVIAFAGCSSEDSAGQSAGTEKSADPIVLKLGHLANTEHDWHKAAVFFAEKVAEKTSQIVKVEVYPNEELGNEMSNIDAIGLGTADMVVSGESLQNWAPLAALIATPYAIISEDHMRKVVEGPLGRKIFDQVKKEAGLVHVTWFERMPRNLTSNRPIASPADINGLIMRVPNVPLFVTAWEAIGAKPTTMAFSEVFTSLQQNTIEAQENPLDLIMSASFFEVQKYVNVTEHVNGWMSLWIGEKQFNGLTPEQQTAITEAGKEARAHYGPLYSDSKARLKSELENKGMQFIETDKDAFQAIAEPAVLDALSDEQRILYEEMQAAK